MKDVISPEEYKIYNDLLEKHKVYATILGSGEIDRIVIRHTTSIGPVTLDEMIKDFHHTFPELSHGTLDDFEQKNGQIYDLEDRFVLSKECHIVSSVELSEIFQESLRPKEAWQIFHRTFPNCRGLLFFSRVGFDNLTTPQQALVHIGRLSGGLSGIGYAFLLQNHKEEWNIYQKAETWVV